MKHIVRTILLFAVALSVTSCNDDWTDEQFSQMVSFKSVPNDLGVTDTYVRYNANGEVTYQLPLIVSGSTTNKSTLHVQVALDNDTLPDLNQRKFGSRPELYFAQLPEKYYSFPNTVEIPAGTSLGVLPINFTLNGIDEAEKWVLPITIVETQNGDYKVNPRKYYRKALLRIRPFNDFSGVYSSTQLLNNRVDDGEANAFNGKTSRAYVVNDSTVFFYAGIRSEDYIDRRNYKIYFHFTKERYQGQKYYVDLYADNPKMNFKAAGRACYSVQKAMDPNKKYLEHTYITIENIDYTYTDYTTIPAYPFEYHVHGSLSLQRDLNTNIPDQDQGIQW